MICNSSVLVNNNNTNIDSPISNPQHPVCIICMISISRIIVVWVEVSGLNLRSLLSTQRLLVKSWKGMCLVDTIDRGSAALRCILMLHLPCLQRDDVIPSSASQHHASRSATQINAHCCMQPRTRLDTLEVPVGSFDGQSRFLPPSFALSRFNSVSLSLTTGARQKGTWLLGNGTILGCLSQSFKVRRPFQI